MVLTHIPSLGLTGPSQRYLELVSVQVDSKGL
jgi:hypothetical protein